MVASRGFCYAVYGDKARDEARLSLHTLREHNDYPATVFGDTRLDGADFAEFDNIGTPGRWAKLNLNNLTPFDSTCYIDADTRVHGSLAAGFDILGSGFDMAITPSANQDGDLLWHVGKAERDTTLEEIGNPCPLQLQAGLFFFRRSNEIDRLFSAWRDEWLRWQDQDQAALLRALYREPVRLWLLGRAFNGGAIVAHRFGSFQERKLM